MGDGEGLQEKSLNSSKPCGVVARFGGMSVMSGNRARVEAQLGSRGFDANTRAQLWQSIDSILAKGPLAPTGAPAATGLALGYIQSGKTTAISALVAAAADCGYRVVIAILGSTNLLLEQNEARLDEALELDSRTDYAWSKLTNPAGREGAAEISSWLTKSRVVLIPVIKNATRLRALAKSLSLMNEELRDVPVLIVDDEADQASLNTRVKEGLESSTFQAISALRTAVPNHLYVQFTATPYAPLLLEDNDHLRPDFVELLQPGPGYTGGREFFVDNAATVTRVIPTHDEQKSSLPTQLQPSLVKAISNFIAGSAMLLRRDGDLAPISMLIHSSASTAMQERYRYLIDRHLTKLRRDCGEARTVSEMPASLVEERARLVKNGAQDLSGEDWLEAVRYSLSEAHLWVVNSATDVNKVDWNISPVHILIGGNKLDRGFTVEGLTVSYMNRPASSQIDTLEQRARAFGYRGDLLPYCQFFGTRRTIDTLRDIVDSEYDLRSRLRDWLDEGRPVGEWAHEVGLLLPEGTRPTREAVIKALVTFNSGPTWHQLRRPRLDDESRAANEALIASIGLDTAGYVDYGRLAHRTIELPFERVQAELLAPWQGVPDGYSPGWKAGHLMDLISRVSDSARPVPIMLMEHPDGGARTREWDIELGFVNLLQGPDPRAKGADTYPGDRNIGGVATDPEQVVVQVHRVRGRDWDNDMDVLTLAIHAGKKQIVRRSRDDRH